MEIGDNAAVVATTGMSDPTDEVRVLLVDDHPVVVEGMRALLAGEQGICVVGTASTGEEAIAAARTSQPSVVLLDLDIPPPSGPDLITKLADVCAASVVMMTMVDEDDALVSCMQAGASGYLLKGTKIDDVMSALRAAHAGEVALSGMLTKRLVSRLAPRPSTAADAETAPAPAATVRLSAREREVLTHVMRGHTNHEIAAVMFISARTVRAHLATAFAKLEVNDRTAAVTRALAAGLIEFDKTDGGPDQVTRQ